MHPCDPEQSRLALYNQEGLEVKSFDYTSDDKVKDFTCAAFNPSGDAVVVGNFNRFFCYANRDGDWEEVMNKEVDNLYTVTALGWKPDVRGV